MTVSIKPLDDMFRSVGMNPDDILRTVRRGYSGAGGPLNPIGYSSSGNAEISQREAKANEILITLDQMNSYRIAVEKMPLAMPVKSAFRYTSGYGRRWGRAHEGIDILAPRGTKVYSATDGLIADLRSNNLGGKVVWIIGPAGSWHYYAHLDGHKRGLNVGDSIKKGDLIGYVGNSGNARHTAPHLHYGIYLDGKGRGAVNPFPYLR